MGREPRAFKRGEIDFDKIRMWRPVGEGARGNSASEVE